LQDDKKELEGELKLRTEEIYALNEKLMVLEINQQNISNQQNDQKQVAEMQAKLDKLFDVNARKVNDMVRLK
jgi:hypothetical protein